MYTLPRAVLIAFLPFSLALAADEPAAPAPPDLALTGYADASYEHLSTSGRFAGVLVVYPSADW